MGETSSPAAGLGLAGGAVRVRVSGSVCSGAGDRNAQLMSARLPLNPAPSLGAPGPPQKEAGLSRGTSSEAEAPSGQGPEDKGCRPRLGNESPRPP